MTWIDWATVACVAYAALLSTLVAIRQQLRARVDRELHGYQPRPRGEVDRGDLVVPAAESGIKAGDPVYWDASGNPTPGRIFPGHVTKTPSGNSAAGHRLDAAAYGVALSDSQPVDPGGSAPTASVTIKVPIRLVDSNYPCRNAVGDIELTKRQAFALAQLLKGLRAEGAMVGALIDWPPEIPVESGHDAIRWLLDQVAVTGEGGAISAGDSNAMKTYKFSLVLTAPKITNADGEALYEAGCDDGTVVTRGGVTHVAFDRQAESLEAAIRSATTQVRAAGFTVAHVEMDALV